MWIGVTDEAEEARASEASLRAWLRPGQQVRSQTEFGNEGL